MRLSVTDVVSPSYFIATAAVELGYFKAEGLDVEFVPPPANPSQALRDGEIDLFGASPYMGLARSLAGATGNCSARSRTTRTGSWPFAPTFPASAATSTP